MSNSRRYLLIALATVGACGDNKSAPPFDGGPDAVPGMIDAQPAADVVLQDSHFPDGPVDARPADAGPDARPADARPIDAQVVDVVLPPDMRPADARPVDAVPIDARAFDARVVDARLPDVAIPDAPIPDASPPDASPDAPIPDASPPDALLGADAGFVNNVIFVSSKSFPNGNLGGIMGADLQCQLLATAAGLPGSYVAYLSTSTQAAKDHLGDARGWVRPDGLPVADTAAQLATGQLWYPINLDENGHRVTSAPVQVATGTKSDGTANVGHTCGDWLSMLGADAQSGGYLTGGAGGYEQSYDGHCSAAIRLYCAGDSRIAPLPAPTTEGRYAFVAFTTFDIGTGLDAADAKCAHDAMAANLPGTYKALLATSSASALSRFDTGGAPWIRPDHVLISATPAALATDVLLAPILMSSTGMRMANYTVWSGASSIGAAGSAATTCNDWTSTQASDHAQSGATGYISRPDFGPEFATGLTTCDQTYPVFYCMQE